MTPIEWLIAFLAACVAVVIILAWFAPEGYESEDGFHYGRNPGGDA